MFTMLDLIVVVFLVVLAVGLLASSLMFLVRNPKIQRVCVYVVAVLSMYMGSVAIRMGMGYYPVQTAFGIAGILLSMAVIAAVILYKDRKKVFLTVKVVSVLVLVMSVMAAFG